MAEAKQRKIADLLAEVGRLKAENAVARAVADDRAIRRQVRRPGRIITDPAAGEHKLTIVLIPGYTGSAVKLMPWFKRLEEFGIDFSTVKVVGTTAPERATDLYNGWICNSW